MRDHTVLELRVVRVVKVVVVDVKLRVGVSLAGSLESNADEVLAQDTGEDRVAERAVLVEDLVDHVPLQDLALVAASDVGNVVLDHRGEGGLVVDVLNPLGELRVPEEGVATHLLAILGGKVDNLIGAVEVELRMESELDFPSDDTTYLSTVGLSSIPLQAVLGRELTEISLDDGSVLAVG
jgi:hypothetical protein